MGKSKKSADDLPVRHESFAENFVANGGRKREAAEAAGFAPGGSAQVTANRLLKDERVKEKIRELSGEANISTREVVGRVASLARIDLAEVAPDNPILKAASERGVSHWIKSITVKKYFDKALETTVEETKVEVHDSLSALKWLGKVRGLEQAPRENDADVMRRRQAYADAIERIYEQTLLEDPTVTRRDIAQGFIKRKPEAQKYITVSDYEM